MVRLSESILSTQKKRILYRKWNIYHNLITEKFNSLIFTTIFFKNELHTRRIVSYFITMRSIVYKYDILLTLQRQKNQS